METENESQKAKGSVLRPHLSRGIVSLLNRVMDIALSLPIWLRFVVVFAVLLVIIMLSGKVIQRSLVPLLYLLLIMGSAGYIWLELKGKRFSHEEEATSLVMPEIDEQRWLDLVIEHLKNCQEASVYLRYFRDPDQGEDQRLRGKRDKVIDIMTRFSQLLLDHKDAFFLIAFRKKSWTDDPKRWLVQKMREIRPDFTEAEAITTVDNRVLVINDEPGPNSSTIYLLDNRYLFYNRISGEMGSERKQYHAEDLANSIMPSLLMRGLEYLFEYHKPEP